jgi:hypothetical protein
MIKACRNRVGHAPRILTSSLNQRKRLNFTLWPTLRPATAITNTLGRCMVKSRRSGGGRKGDGDAAMFLGTTILYLNKLQYHMEYLTHRGDCLHFGLPRFDARRIYFLAAKTSEPAQRPSIVTNWQMSARNF